MVGRCRCFDGGGGEVALMVGRCMCFDGGGGAGALMVVVQVL